MLNILVEELPIYRRLGAREYFLRKLLRRDGQCYPLSKYKIVYVFVSTNREQVKRKGYQYYLECLCHELVHFRWAFWNHNKKFNETIDQLLYSNRRWPRTRLYLDPLSDHTTPGSRPDNRSGDIETT